MNITQDQRKRLPDVRPSITIHGVHNGLDYYVTVGFYDDVGNRDKPGEIFVTIAKEGSDMRHFIGCWAQLASIALQYGLPWDKISDKIANTPGKPMMCSIVDSINTAIKTRADIIDAESEREEVNADEDTAEVEEVEEHDGGSVTVFQIAKNPDPGIAIIRLEGINENASSGTRYFVKRNKDNYFMSSDGNRWLTPKEHHDSLFKGWVTVDGALRDWRGSYVRKQMFGE